MKFLYFVLNAFVQTNGWRIITYTKNKCFTFIIIFKICCNKIQNLSAGIKTTKTYTEAERGQKVKVMHFKQTHSDAVLQRFIVLVLKAKKDSWSVKYKTVLCLNKCLRGWTDDAGLLAICVVPADVKLCYLLCDAFCYRSAAGDDQPPRHHIKRPTWMERENNKNYFNKVESLISQVACGWVFYETVKLSF